MKKYSWKVKVFGSVVSLLLYKDDKFWFDRDLLFFTNHNTLARLRKLKYNMIQDAREINSRRRQERKRAKKLTESL